jgi:hypothetical protein
MQSNFQRSEVLVKPFCCLELRVETFVAAQSVASSASIKYPSLLPLSPLVAIKNLRSGLQ